MKDTSKGSHAAHCQRKVVEAVPLWAAGSHQHLGATSASATTAAAAAAAYKLVSTRCALEKAYATSHCQGQEWGTASHPPGPP